METKTSLSIYNEPLQALMKTLNAEQPDPVMVAVAERGFSIEKAISSPNTLQKLSAKNATSTLKLIVALLKRQADFYNVRKELTTDQAVMISQTLIDEYQIETIDDVVLMLKMARAGNFGTVYGKIDGETVMGWMALYLDRKYEVMEKQHQNQKHAANKIEDFAPEVLQALKKATEQKPAPQPKQYSQISCEDYKAYFWEFKDDFTIEDLKAMRREFEVADAMGNRHYKKELEYIESKVKEKRFCFKCGVEIHQNNEILCENCRMELITPLI